MPGPTTQGGRRVVTGRAATTIGLHFFNPVPMMQLVELVHLETTSPAVVADALAFVKATKKTPVLCKDTPGFVVNRLLVPYMAQALKLVEDGVADYKAVDVAMRLGAGHPMGPFTLADYVGLDTLLSILQNWTALYPGEPAFFVPPSLEAMVKKMVTHDEVRCRTVIPLPSLRPPRPAPASAHPSGVKARHHRAQRNARATSNRSRGRSDIG